MFVAKSKTSRRSSANPNKGKRAPMPTREAILQFITDNPDQSGKREVARAFGLKGQQRITLKALLGELQDEGLIKKQGKRFAKPGTLPSVTVLDITARDREGGLLARPVQWDEETDGKYPVVSIVNHPRSKNPSAGVGDRVLARISTPPTGSPRGRVMKVLDRNKGTILGVYRPYDEPDNGFIGRIEPTDRKQDELLIHEKNLAEATPGSLVEISVVGKNHASKRRVRPGGVMARATRRRLSRVGVTPNSLNACQSGCRALKPPPFWPRRRPASSYVSRMAARPSARARRRVGLARRAPNIFVSMIG